MKTTTVLLVLVAAIGCSKDKPKAKTTPTAVAPAPPSKPGDKPPPSVTADTQVSPGLAVSPDIVAACNLKVPSADTVNPKFDYDKDELLPEDRVVLDQIATCLTAGALKGRRVELVGRADPRGTEEYNLGLGSKRASSVGQYLGRLGVTAPQMAETSRGALEATGTDEAGWKKDRRVDIVLVGNS